MPKGQRKWTFDEEVVIHDMQEAGKNLWEIAEALGRTYSSLDGHLRQDQTNARRREKRAEEIKIFKANAPIRKLDIPEEVLADRARRAEARANQSLTAQLMGDPV